MSEATFKSAVNYVKSLPPNGSVQPSPETKLKFYSLFKQATEGPLDVKKHKQPSRLNVIARMKW